MKWFKSKEQFAHIDFPDTFRLNPEPRTKIYFLIGIGLIALCLGFWYGLNNSVF